MKKRVFEYYCDDIENVENYEKAKADDFKGWEAHHRLETHNSDGEKRIVDISHKELKALDMYWHRPSSELIFLTVSDHNTLHHKGKRLSDEAKKKISKASKGKPKSEEHVKKVAEANKGKHRTEEQKRRMSEVQKGKHMSEDAKRKMSESRKGKHFSEEHKKSLSEALKGHSVSEETRRKLSEARKNISEETRKKCSEAHKGKKMSEETKKKMSEKRKGFHWFNNGKINIRSKECPEGFVPGRLK